MLKGASPPAPKARGRRALEFSTDAAADLYAEPKLVLHRGRVPEELIERLAA